MHRGYRTLTQGRSAHCLAHFLLKYRLWARLHVWKRSSAGAFLFGHLHLLTEQLPPPGDLVPDGETTPEQLDTAEKSAAAENDEQTHRPTDASYRWGPCSTT